MTLARFTAINTRDPSKLRRVVHLRPKTATFAGAYARRLALHARTSWRVEYPLPHLLPIADQGAGVVAARGPRHPLGPDAVG